jgi:hypothetical protein
MTSDPNKTTKGLSFPTGNAGEELRRLMLEEANTPVAQPAQRSPKEKRARSAPTPPSPPEEKTSNDHLIIGSNELSNDVSIKQSKEPLSKSSITHASNRLDDQLSRQPRRAVEALSQQGGGDREPVMRLNVELTESLHLRLKEYCVRRRVPIRSLVTALIEDFLEEEDAAK